jgi:hypothetical protein
MTGHRILLPGETPNPISCLLFQMIKHLLIFWTLWVVQFPESLDFNGDKVEAESGPHTKICIFFLRLLASMKIFILSGKNRILGLEITPSQYPPVSLGWVWESSIWQFWSPVIKWPSQKRTKLNTGLLSDSGSPLCGWEGTPVRFFTGIW